MSRFQPAVGTERSLARRLFDTPERAFMLMRAAWPSAVGAELARRTELVALERRVLWVRVPDASWRRVLHRMRGTLIRRMRRVVGDLAPQRLAFVEGEIAAPATPEPATSPAPGPTTAPEMVVDSAERIDDPELRRLFLETAARYLDRSDTRSSDA